MVKSGDSRGKWLFLNFYVFKGSILSVHVHQRGGSCRLVNKIREACQEKKNGTSVNMSQLIIATSNNIVSRCLLGQKFDTADDDLLDFELTQADLKAMIMDFFVGGSDTTSTALEWAFAELIKNPRTMKKSQEEVRIVVGNKSKVEENDVKQMKYLECIVKLTLRLHPPLPRSVPRETRSSVSLGGYYIPPKTTVLMNLWGIQRDPEFWEN
ncbi:hypothetical protein K1719_020067 [Acacia pycnantha]|nr:hypothetical protein K1719_020067 [Acacia pycnantha]